LNQAPVRGASQGACFKLDLTRFRWLGCRPILNTPQRTAYNKLSLVFVVCCWSETRRCHVSAEDTRADTMQVLRLDVEEINLLTNRTKPWNMIRVRVHSESSVIGWRPDWPGFHFSACNTSRLCVPLHQRAAIQGIINAKKLLSMDIGLLLPMAKFRGRVLHDCD
jgi:hypothetical protein